MASRAEAQRLAGRELTLPPLPLRSPVSSAFPVSIETSRGRAGGLGWLREGSRSMPLIQGFKIAFTYDAEAEDEIGLVTEAATLGELLAKLPGMVAELIEGV
jgi:hypothetical protein